MKYFSLYISLLFLAFCCFGAIAQTPDIAKADKISGTFGELVTISGSGFSANKDQISVHFGSAKGQVVTSSEFVIEVLAPAGANYHNIYVTNLGSRLTGFASTYYNLAFNGEDFNGSSIKESLKINEDKELFDLCNCDFNGDGLNDVASTNNTDDAGSTSITVYQNITQSSQTEIAFQKINSVNLNTGKGARNVTCADLNGDGKPELVVGKGGGNADRIYVFKNVSTTNAIKFDPFITILLSENVSSSTTRRLKIHDLDKDGRPDIVMTDQGVGNIFIFGNKSANGLIDFPTSARQVIATSAGSLVGLDVADFDGDNKPEIICNSDKASMFLLPNESAAGTINMGIPKTISIPGANLVNLKVGDLDNDGDKDIAVSNLVNNIFVLVNNGDKDNYNLSSPKYIETGRAPWGLDIGDLNGDGLPDILVATTDASDKLTALINTSSGSTLSYIPYNIGNADVSFNVVISDMNGDAKPDVGYVNRNAANNELIFLRNSHCILANILPDDPPAVCSNKPVKLRATPALKVDYNWLNVGTGQAIDGGVTADIITAGTYKVAIVSAADGCENHSDEVVLVDGGDNLPPTVTINSPEVVCEGASLTLSAELFDGVSYFWQTPGADILEGNSITIDNANIDNSGRYALVLEASGCRTDPVFAKVDVSSIPTMEILTSQGELFCEGSINTLTVPLYTGAQYEWKKDGSIISGVTGNTYNSAESGTFTVNVTNAYNCVGNSNTQSIKEVKQPVAAFAEITSSCLNEVIQFENTSTFDGTVDPTFLWEFGDGVTSTEKDPSHTYSSPGTFTISLSVGYDNTSCSDSYTGSISVAKFLNLEIKVDGAPVPDGTFNLCEGTEVELSVMAQDGKVLWSTGETSAKIQISEGGIYSVTSGNGTGCSSSDEIEVKIVDNIDLKTSSESHRIEGGESAQLGASGAEFYDWSPAESLDNPMIPNPIATPIETTEFTVLGSNTFGCLDSAFVMVYVDEKVTIAVDAPRSFTPNGDGMNDIWIINNLDVYEACPIRIFNRLGQNVYEASQYNNDWDGYMDGRELPEGAYYFILTCSASEVHTGDITLIR